MKCVLVGPAYPLRGGIAQYTDALQRALAERHEARIVTFSKQYPNLFFPGKSQVDESSPAETAVAEALLDSSKPSSWRETARRIAQCSPDLVLFQWWHPFLYPCYISLVRRLKRSSNPPVIVFLCHNLTSHESHGFPGRSKVERALVGRLFKRVDGFLVQSTQVGQSIEEIAPSSPVRRVFHPVYHHYSAWDVEAPPGDGRPSLLFFGNIRDYKGLDVLLEAAALLPGDLDFRLTVAGDCYLDPEALRAQSDELGLSERIEWRFGYVANHEVPALFRGADVVVLPYKSATQSGIVPLAYLFEVPVIATNVGGLSEVVEEGRTGFLVAPGNPKALSRAISSYFKEHKKEDFRGPIAEFRNRLDWEQVVQGLLGVYRDCRSKT